MNTLNTNKIFICLKNINYYQQTQLKIKPKTTHGLTGILFMFQLFHLPYKEAAN